MKRVASTATVLAISAFAAVVSGCSDQKSEEKASTPAPAATEEAPAATTAPEAPAATPEAPAATTAPEAPAATTPESAPAEEQK